MQNIQNVEFTLAIQCVSGAPVSRQMGSLEQTTYVHTVGHQDLVAIATPLWRDLKKGLDQAAIERSTWDAPPSIEDSVIVVHSLVNYCLAKYPPTDIKHPFRDHTAALRLVIKDLGLDLTITHPVTENPHRLTVSPNDEFNYGLAPMGKYLSTLFYNATEAKDV